ncbi:uncharacterized protein C4orf45-like [Dendronephthya gigantea]|uniref:uncharacterized protein C4orf45-like n=1 Tax=Dendronephthya gigantea TaxID=151771 RepID=UPI0010695113|nr:uncharacterized protein C4orf45-like [Dendronephthya gigantea]
MAAVNYLGFRWNQSHKYYNPIYNPYVGKGAVLFTGPDAIKDHKTKILNATATGIGTLSPEGTSDLEYVLRAARGCPHPRPKSVKVGEIGWDVASIREDHTKLWRSGHQIKLGEFRLACELRHTHLYQNPWYPPPRSKEQVTRINLRKANENRCKTQPNPYKHSPSAWPSSTDSSLTNIRLRHKQKPITLVR